MDKGTERGGGNAERRCFDGVLHHVIVVDVVTVECW